MQLEETLITYGAPTLAGIKLANLFRYHAPPGLNLLPEIETMDRRLRPLGIRLCILKHCQRTGSHLLYLYREQALHCRLNRPGDPALSSAVRLFPGLRVRRAFGTAFRTVVPFRRISP